MSLFDDFDDDLEDDLNNEPVSAPISVSTGLLPAREAPDTLGHAELERQILQYFNDGHMPHAMIFAGPEGIGKATFAFRVARFLLKHGKDAGEESGGGLFGEALPATKPENMDLSLDDVVFRQVASAGHPDLLTIERPFDEKKGRKQSTVPVEEARKVTPFLRRTASYGGWRVVIVDDADTMNRNSQNAILKILEEPPSQTLLILIAHRMGALIPTIRSRCRMVSFQPLSLENFSTLMKKEQAGLPDTDIRTLYGISGGSVGQGVRILNEGGLEVVAQAMILLSTWPKWDWPQIHHLADGLAQMGQDESFKTFQTVLLWIIEAMVRARAQGTKLPQILDNESLDRLMSHYNLAEWIEICDNLKAHFDTVEHSNLDKKQAVLGIFPLFTGKDAA